MELLPPEPSDHGVRIPGIYVIDDDGTEVVAGPFESDAAAITWINQRQEMLNQDHLAPA